MVGEALVGEEKAVEAEASVVREVGRPAEKETGGHEAGVEVNGAHYLA